MSIFGKIMSAIFGSSQAQAAPAGAAPAGGAGGASAGAGGGGAGAAPALPPGATPLSDVDVGNVLSGLAAKNKEKLDWKKSIVDLMKLLGLDSSLGARKELAGELGYTGDTNDFSVDEYLAAQAGDAEARGQWRQCSGRSQALNQALRLRGEQAAARLARDFGHAPEHGCTVCRPPLHR